MPSYPGFLGPTYQSASYIADAEICLNYFMEKNESPNAPTPYVLIPTYGVEEVTSVSQAPIRAEFQTQDRAFFIAGAAFYELLYDAETGVFSTTQRGTVENDTRPATISSNAKPGNQLGITSGGTFYCYDLGTDTLTASGVPGTTATMGGSSNTRFVYLDATSGTFYISGSYDGLSWDATQAAQTTTGDPWIALCTTPDQLIRCFGENTREVYQDVGTAPFPYQPIQEAFQPQGILTPFGFGVDDTVTWLGQNAQGHGIVYRANGYGAQRVSTHAIEAAIETYDTSDATAWTYQMNGHPFFVLTFATSEKTWVFDGLTGFWHERDYWDVRTGESKAYRLGSMMSAFDMILCGDRLTGSIYRMSPTLYTDVGGAAIRRVRQPPRLSFNQKRFTTHSLQVVMDVGQGTATGQGADPMMLLETSKDGSKTFGAGYQAAMGKQGEYGTRVKWNMLGQARNRVDRFTTSDPVPGPIVDCEINVSVGVS